MTVLIILLKALINKRTHTHTHTQNALLKVQSGNMSELFQTHSSILLALLILSCTHKPCLINICKDVFADLNMDFPFGNHRILQVNKIKKKSF